MKEAFAEKLGKNQIQNWNQPVHKSQSSTVAKYRLCVDETALCILNIIEDNMRTALA